MYVYTFGVIFKMKFRVSGKDFTIFVIFAIFLFYLCCLLTSNVHQLSVDGSFSGLNPIPGLTQFFGATMLLFIVFVVLIIASSSSYIFERKKASPVHEKYRDA